MQRDQRATASAFFSAILGGIDDRRFFDHIPDTREPEERNAIRAFGDQDNREAPETIFLFFFFYPSNSDTGTIT